VFNNLNVGFEKGKLTIIYGSVGSGKTSLIYCILN
jgi:ABC-type transport system involved in cytochrome bd biosynthesis fused ATPase/permease subunit